MDSPFIFPIPPRLTLESVSHKVEEIERLLDTSHDHIHEMTKNSEYELQNKISNLQDRVDHVSWRCGGNTFFNLFLLGCAIFWVVEHYHLFGVK